MPFELDRRGVLLGLSATALAACTTPPPAPRYPQLTFTHLPAFRLNAARLDVVEAYAPAPGARDVAAGMPVPPAEAARRWASDRLSPRGPAGEIVFTITDASVIEVPLKRTTGLRGVVTDDQSERYDGHLAAGNDADGNRHGVGNPGSRPVRRALPVPPVP